MKKFTLLMAAAFLWSSGFAQEDSTQLKEKKDTIRIGNILIIKKGKGDDDNDKDVEVTMGRKRASNSKIKTNWFVLDFGFSNYMDETDYSSTGSYLVNRPGTAEFGKSDLKLRSGK